MHDHDKSKEELLNELYALRQDYLRLKTLMEKKLSGLQQKEDGIRVTHELLYDVQKLARIGIWEWD